MTECIKHSHCFCAESSHVSSLRGPPLRQHVKIETQPNTDVCEMLSSNMRQENDSLHFDLHLQCIVVVRRVNLSVTILMKRKKALRV